MENVELLTIASLGVVFLLARVTVRYAVVFRRNNVAAGLAFVLFGLALVLLGWWGFIAFTAGTLVSAWQWAASIARANDSVARTRSPVLTARAEHARI